MGCRMNDFKKNKNEKEGERNEEETAIAFIREEVVFVSLVLLYSAERFFYYFKNYAIVAFFARLDCRV